MLHERRLEMVRTLTRAAVEALAPTRLDRFEEEFAAFALTGGRPQVQERTGYLAGRDQGLDTMLVAGMFFQVLVEAEQLPAGAPERVSFLKRRAKDYLVDRLSGQITLSRFFRLLSLIDDNATRYFEGLKGDWAGLPPTPDPLPIPAVHPAPVRAEELRQALAGLSLIPRGRRKLTQESLFEFLQMGPGRWFKLLDFEDRFQVNKKTAWAYLNQLLKEGILEHNGEKANKVRYTLAGRFLKDGPARADSPPFPPLLSLP